MSMQIETAALVAQDGGEVDAKAVAAIIYLTEPLPSIEIATRKVSRRFGVSIPLAREVCRLAQIGGAL
jgi:hypothetical protein